MPAQDSADSDAASPSITNDRRELTAAEKRGIMVAAIIVIIIVAAFVVPYLLKSTQARNMQISVSSSICWQGSVGGVGSSRTVQGCQSDSWIFPNERIISAAIQLNNKCNYDYYSGSMICDSGSLTVTAYHTNGQMCNTGTTSTRYGLVTVTCSEY